MRKLLGTITAILLVAGAAPARADTPFVVEDAPFLMGQAPTWKPDGSGFVYAKKVEGKNQVFTADLDGSNAVCVTCGIGLPGPNHVAHYRPQGDKILFHSFGEHYFQFGGPGYGGVGSNVFLVDPDGDPDSLVNLTKGDEGEDNFHAYWSPDGTRLVWTHIAWDIHRQGRGLFDVRVADYADDAAGGGPRLENVQVVRGPSPHFFETQWWSPDGRGFLFTETVDNALNLELFFMDLTTGSVRRLTEHPAWDEQALFTPDGEKVIFMSTRDHPSTWETWAHASWSAGLPDDADYLLIAPLFLGAFFSPVFPPATDLYEVDFDTLETRRLTWEGDEGWIIPEFAWDPSGTRLLWTEQKNRDSVRVSNLDDPGRDVQEATALPGEPPPSSAGFDAFVAARTVIGRYG